MAKIIHPLLALLASLSRQELAQRTPLAAFVVDCAMDFVVAQIDVGHFDQINEVKHLNLGTPEFTE